MSRAKPYRGIGVPPMGLMAVSASHSLSNRFRIATQLARTVCSIHNLDMVHKSIRPENILLFRDGKSELGSAFLLGFENVRLGGASYSADQVS